MERITKKLIDKISKEIYNDLEMSRRKLPRVFLNGDKVCVTGSPTYIVVIDKNKFGWTGKLNFRFDGKHQRFTQTYDDGTAMSSYLTEDDELEF